LYKDSIVSWWEEVFWYKGGPDAMLIHVVNIDAALGEVFFEVEMAKGQHVIPQTRALCVAAT
jgi:hypothetical protein